MKNNKGFTLIELLAVMVILAIIALIATPVVMNVIKNARRAAAVDSAYGIVKAAEAYYANELLVSGGNFDVATKGTDLDLTGTAIEYKGTKATGKIDIDANGGITFDGGKITINGFDCNFKSDGTTIECPTPA